MVDGLVPARPVADGPEPLLKLITGLFNSKLLGPGLDLGCRDPIICSDSVQRGTASPYSKRSADELEFNPGDQFNLGWGHHGAVPDARGRINQSFSSSSSSSSQVPYCSGGVPTVLSTFG